jgi:adenine phosphoribosyltransferase
MDLKKLIRTIPDFPQPGIQFKDIESITENSAAFTYVIDAFAKQCRSHHVEKIVALDARGFLFGAALALQEGLPLVMARKKGKLAGECVGESYALEYGEAEIELQKTALSQGDRVMIVDDLLATGGTASAAAKVVEKLGAKVSVFMFVIELLDLNGREKLSGVDTISLVQY